MLTNSILSGVYWSFGLVCIGGAFLIVIAVCALMLLLGESPREHRPRRLAWSQSEDTGDRTITLQFFRIGQVGQERMGHFAPNQWYTVGAAKKADFRLDADDIQLADIHFRICIDQGVALVEPLEAETFVNGVPIRKLGTVKARSGDLIRAGSYEYRVMFSSCKEGAWAK